MMRGPPTSAIANGVPGGCTADAVGFWFLRVADCGDGQGELAATFAASDEPAPLVGAAVVHQCRLDGGNRAAGVLA
jgi:hypothetical protein